MLGSGRGGAAHLTHALLQRACRNACTKDRRHCVERRFAAGGGVALDDECSGLAARHYAQILEAVDRQIGEGAVDRRVVDVALQEVAGALGGNQESARHRLRSALRQSERTGDLRRVQYVLDGDRRL
jgi:hypothetical protein